MERTPPPLVSSAGPKLSNPKTRTSLSACVASAVLPYLVFIGCALASYVLRLSSRHYLICHSAPSMTDFDRLRATEFARLDEANHVYLDYTGAGLHPQSVIQHHILSLQHDVLGNPHSENPTSKLATERISYTRSQILYFFNADPREYEVIFTPNASGALKLVGEAYPFQRNSTYALLADNHNSVHGIREYANAARATVTYLPINKELRMMHSEAVESILKQRKKGVPNLFAYPAQSNFSGVKHPLQTVALAQRLGYDVILDVAAYVPTNPLDLSVVKPEFLSVSFYKMFGFPTGVGALIARKDALRRLRRPWFSGGTVRFVSVQNRVHMLEDLGEAFEDGTVNFLLIPSVSRGIKFLENLGMQHVKKHVSSMTGLILSGLNSIYHSNGKQIMELYGPNNLHMRGGTITFNVLTDMGVRVDPRIVEKAANEEKISLRTGCFCNPGGGEAAFNLSASGSMKCFVETADTGFTVEKFSRCMKDVYYGAVRVSVGIATNEVDIERFLSLLKTFIDWQPVSGTSVQDVEAVGTEKPFSYDRRPALTQGEMGAACSTTRRNGRNGWNNVSTRKPWCSWEKPRIR